MWSGSIVPTTACGLMFRWAEPVLTRQEVPFFSSVGRLVARLPWAHDTRLQQLRLLLPTTNISTKSENLLFAQR
jgi:hypothetical protein